MSGVLQRAVAARITHVAFGDLFLQDIRDYRVRQLAPTGLEPLFPLWCSSHDTPALARAMLDGGLKAVVTCVDPNKVPATFAGRAYDATLLADLPPDIDPCGERGEFHTLCFAGPMFREPIALRVGDIVSRDGFCFADVLPDSWQG